MTSNEVWDRFWIKVEKTPSCWIWVGARNTDGYGNFGIHHGTTRRAHRVAYEWLKGPIPAGLVLDHLCRNPSCVRPDHLEAVTNGENLRRGQGFTGTKSRQTHCIHGHEFNEANTNRKKNGTRECRACASRRSSEKWQRTKQKAKGEAA